MMDRIITSKPVNKTAGLVMSRGEHWTPYLKEHTAAHWENPPKCLPVDPNRLDHTGTKFGRFTVVGLVSHKTKNKKARWLVRCVCGR